MDKKILVVGGYGAVGSIISLELSKIYPEKVIVAGRSYEKAKKFTDNRRLIPMKLDHSKIDELNFLDEISLVIMCIDQTNTTFVEACVEKGVQYIDISANQKIIEQIDLLDTKAKKNKTSIISSVGIAPGITNLLVQHLLKESPKNKTIDIYVLLGLGEKHGDAAFQWTFDNIDTTYMVGNNKIKSFTLPKMTNLLGNRTFYSFDFSDQHTLLKTNKISVTTRMAFDSSFLTRTIGFLRKIGLTKIFRNKTIQKTFISIFKKSLIGTDVFGVKAVVTAENDQLLEASVTGNGEGKATAFVAVQTAIYLLENSIPSGAHHLHQVIEDIPLFLNNLTRYDSELKINLKANN